MAQANWTLAMFLHVKIIYVLIPIIYIGAIPEPMN